MTNEGAECGCSYQFSVASGYTVWTSVAAARGNVYTLATSTTSQQFPQSEPLFKTVHDSFRLFRKVDV